jgi:hypothetical protein
MVCKSRTSINLPSIAIGMPETVQAFCTWMAGSFLAYRTDRKSGGSRGFVESARPIKGRFSNPIAAPSFWIRRLRNAPPNQGIPFLETERP